MTVTVNGRPHETEAATLADLLLELGYSAEKVATAVNGDFVRLTLRDSTELSSGDHIDVLAPMQGG